MTIHEFYRKYPLYLSRVEGIRVETYSLNLQVSEAVSDIEFIMLNGRNIKNLPKIILGTLVLKMEAAVKEMKHDFEGVTDV